MPRPKPPTKPRAKTPNACPQCGGRLTIHHAKAECVVPGCGWKGQAT